MTEQPLCLQLCSRYLLSSYVPVAGRRGSAWQGRISGGGLDITHQPQVFLLISSNGVALSREHGTVETCQSLLFGLSSSGFQGIQCTRCT